jgi:hypothetical protein
MNVSRIEFSRPRKIDGSTYTCQLYEMIGREKQSISLVFPKSKILSLKSSSNNASTNESTLYFKCKDDLHKLMFDFNHHIIDVVKKNYQTWFVSNMSPEFIEEYFSNTLTYHKDHGQMIKLKCVGGFELIPKNTSPSARYDINVVFNNLRFYKQKFVLECIIKGCEESDSKYELIDDDDSDMHCSDDELPEPEPEEVRKIKKVYLKKLKQQQDKLQKQLDEIESKKDEVYQLMTSLELSEQFCEIVTICEQIENNCE